MYCREEVADVGSPGTIRHLWLLIAGQSASLSPVAVSLIFPVGGNPGSDLCNNMGALGERFFRDLRVLGAACRSCWIGWKFGDHGDVGSGGGGGGGAHGYSVLLARRQQRAH